MSSSPLRERWLTLLAVADGLGLCSDGWWENVSDEEMEGSLRAAWSPQEWLAQMAETIARAAQNPQDNCTAIAAFVGAAEAA